MKILLIGPPGSGKGLLAQHLSKEMGIKHLSTGDLVREEIEKKSSAGNLIKKYSDSGSLVPDRIIFELVKKSLKKDFILEGFPRRKTQARMLSALVNFDLIFVLDCREKLLIERTFTRRICENCRAIYNLKTLKPKKEGICDICRGKLIQREDEKPEVVKHRLKIYEKKTKPVLNYYKNEEFYKGRIIKINAEKHIREILNTAMQYVKNNSIKNSIIKKNGKIR